MLIFPSISLGPHPPLQEGNLVFPPGLSLVQKEDVAPRQPFLQLFVLGCVIPENLKLCFLPAHFVNDKTWKTEGEGKVSLSVGFW